MHSEFKRELSMRGDFTVSAAYEAIDVRAPRGRIDRYELHDFVRDYFMVMSDAEADAIIRRCDNDGDECLNYEEFCEATRLTSTSASAPIASETMRTSFRATSPMRSTFRESSPIRSSLTGFY